MDTVEITREAEKLKQMQNQLDDAYGCIRALIGIVSQLPGVETVDIKKALSDGLVAMPHLIPGSEGAAQAQQ